ncbi:LysR substrate-binding domain-containing protein [Limnohabitans sp.]|uniref:LysR substrate-binding domain-containing protein n=1 Tax=Limnohabitans sp. TaxID=1907725 RepID=UPI00286F013F|nr:LysR substrate-binding domain-containing protein [Limnohabitans sp.]
METKWLEDFVSLAETRSFSQSAKLRHVTQPAFSRRIQALEAWAGVDLVDRSSYPTRLTVAGQTLHAQAIDMLQSLQTSRAMLRGHASDNQNVVEFAVPHTLALTYFPGWMAGLQHQFGEIKSRLTALNVHDAVLRLVEGGCDFLIAYHHPSQPLQLDPDRFDMVVLGEELLAPFAKPTQTGQSLFELPATARKSAPYLAYASGAYLSRVVDFLLNDIKTTVHLNRVYETDMAESLKAMALEGHGVAFLPLSAVQKEVREQKLVQVRLPSGPSLEAVMEIRAYREKPQAFHPSHEMADLLWRHLVEK